MSLPLQIATWWATQFAFGVLAAPILLPIFGGRTGPAYATAKIVGAAFATYCALVLAMLHLLPFATGGIAAGVAILTGLAAIAVIRRPERIRELQSGLREILYVEAVATVFLVGGAILRAGHPELLGVEKFMNLAFLNAAYSASSMPPADPWFAGETINYYHFGHVVAAMLTHLAAVPTAVGYNLMMAQVVAWAAGAAAAFASNVLSEVPRTGRVVQRISGVAAALILLVGGNGHSFIYGAAWPLFHLYWLSGPPAKNFFYPDSTRYIGFNPSTEDKAFTEFPAYSFAVGDLHAHYLDMSFALALILIFWAGVARTSAEDRRRWPFPWPIACLAGLVLGFVIMTNTWDFLSYGLLYAICGALLIVLRGPFGFMPVVRYGFQGLVTAALAAVIALPHLLNFASFAQGIAWAEGRTPLWQLVVIWGHFAVIALAVVVFAIALAARTRGRSPVPIILIGLVLTSVVLLVIPETARVLDIYGFDHRRANTMFKLSYEAFVMLALVAGTAVGLAASLKRIAASMIALAVCAMLLLPPFVYPLLLWDQTLRPGQAPFTLDGLIFMKTNAPDDVALRRYLLDHKPAEGEAILEAAPLSYTYGGRLSASTGVPTVLGWEMHEFLWRGPDAGAHDRARAIERFYTNADLAERCAFIAEHRLRYVVIGDFERERYPQVDVSGLKTVGTVIFEQRNSLIIDVGGGETGKCAQKH